MERNETNIFIADFYYRKHPSSKDYFFDIRVILNHVYEQTKIFDCMEKVNIIVTIYNYSTETTKLIMDKTSNISKYYIHDMIERLTTYKEISDLSINGTCTIFHDSTDVKYIDIFTEFIDDEKRSLVIKNLSGRISIPFNDSTININKYFLEKFMEEF